MDDKLLQRLINKHYEGCKEKSKKYDEEHKENIHKYDEDLKNKITKRDEGFWRLMKHYNELFEKLKNDKGPNYKTDELFLLLNDIIENTIIEP